MLDSYRSGHGFAGTDEYEPIGADNSLIATGLPAACMVSDPSTVLGVLPSGVDADEAVPVWTAAQGSCEATYPSAPNPGKPLHEHLRIAATVDHPGYWVLRLLSYPAWQVKVNGQSATELPRRDDGLIAVPVPRGPVEVTVDWTTTPDVIAGRWLSALFVLLLAGLWLLERKLRRSRLS